MPPPVLESMMSYSCTAATFTVPLCSVPLPPQCNGRAKAHATSVDRHNAPPKTSPPTQDFHLDILFSPIWMSGPHVFSFNKDGTVVRPKACQFEPYPDYYAHKPSRHTNGIAVNHIDIQPDGSLRHNSARTRSYADAAKSSLSNGFSLKEKPWKNVAITEEDKVPFEAIQAKKRVSGLKETTAAEEATFVYTWPPVSYSRLEPDEDIQEPGNHSTDENEAPQLSYSSSADTSDSDEEFSIPPPEQRGKRAPFTVLQELATPRDEEPLEKVVGFGKLRRRAPPPLTLQTEDLDADVSGCFLFGTGTVPIATSTDGFLSPLTAIATVNSQLSATLLRAPYSVA